MKALLRHPVRVVARLLWMIAEFTIAALNYARWCGLSKNCTGAMRAAWLQHSSSRMLRIFRTEIQTHGTVPKSGLLVSNHLSYLDILVIASITPAMFVAKREVRSWPVFGFFAKLAGTLFVDREHRSRVGQTTNEIQSALDEDALVVLFPEGTSSNGETVLPFKSSLLEPATRQTHSLFADLIQYQLDDGDVGEEICYWKDMTLVPHLINLMSKRSIRASVRFTQLRESSTDRKELARQLHSEILRLKEAPAF
ncbi:MAG TPA: lysophospholipid acyltransferase family protein [Verrucomicrobiae bacterium]|jgi:1-acyl-sn-glycerol-3-phosphate acyltransferase|nr:lysophospholipid acyltransferase family protein [Verrucomicrobiae bacterium]